MSVEHDTPEVHNPARLAALKSLGILDSPPEPAFDDIVLIAAALCGMPIALVSLVDETRQWFKARVGLDLSETPVEQAVCAHVLDRDTPLIIPDLSQDPRTRNNPLVTGPGGIQFYAGVPLRLTNGHVLGSLCVIDVKPRSEGLTEAQVAGLEALGRQVIHMLALRRRIMERETSLIASYEARREMEAQAHRTDAAHAAGRTGTFELDVAANSLDISDETRAIFGLPETPATLRPEDLEALVLPEDQGIQSTADTRGHGTAELEVTYRIRRPSDGEIRSISRRASFEYDAAGAPLRMFGVVQDITEQTVINQELSHRLKNMLAMVMALASQTLKRIPDKAPVQAFEQRLVALGVAHDALLRQSWVSAPLREIIIGVVGLLGQASRVHLQGPVMTVGQKAALGLSLVLHELTTNAMKYGALSSDGGQVELSWRIEDAAVPQLVITWHESGGPVVAVPERKGFGTRLISLGLLGTGGAHIDYNPSGLVATLSAPLGDAQKA